MLKKGKKSLLHKRKHFDILPSFTNSIVMCQYFKFELHNNAIGMQDLVFQLLKVVFQIQATWMIIVLGTFVCISFT